MSYWTDPTHHASAVAASWLAHPLVRARVNRRVSGSAEVWPTQYLHAQLRGKLPVRNALSVGCGMGALERDLVGQGIVDRITGIDFSGEVLEQARAAAGDERIEYEAADAFAYLKAHENAFDAIFFHHSLHHFERIDELLALVRGALVEGGVLWLDEFVGPSMSQWSWRRLVRPNLEYYRLPRAVRRVKLIRTPVNPDDPTEAICAADILPAVHARFEVLEQRDYGGNLVALLYPNLRHDAAELDRAVQTLLDREEALLARGAKSFHTVLLARR